MRQAKARREAAGKLPMLVKVGRTHLPGQSSIANRQTWDAEHIAAFAAACAEVAKAVHPEHLDVAPEVNVYLRRYPDQTDAVQALVVAVKQAVKRASPTTRLLVSFNAEVLRGAMARAPAATARSALFLCQMPQRKLPSRRWWTWWMRWG